INIGRADLEISRLGERALDAKPEAEIEAEILHQQRVAIRTPGERVDRDLAHPHVKRGEPLLCNLPDLVWLPEGRFNLGAARNRLAGPRQTAEHVTDFLGN